VSYVDRRRPHFAVRVKPDGLRRNSQTVVRSVIPQRRKNGKQCGPVPTLGHCQSSRMVGASLCSAAAAQDLRALPGGDIPPPRHAPDQAGAVVPFQLHTESGLLSFFSNTMMFGTPVDITLSELAIESFFPADASTAALLKRT
jgi:MmyB-like transcription regulator ligand binding domain